MRKLFLHVLPALVIPAVFGYCLWGIWYGEGWASLAHAGCIGVIVPVSGIVGASFVGLALRQRRRGRRDWRWWLASGVIAGGPALFTLLRQLVI